jgi:hypothetical protein
MILQEFDDVRFEWVRGHQDDAQKYEDLPLIARLNIKCDKAAKECMRGGTIPSTRAQPLPGHKATLYLSNNMVTSKINEQIQYTAQAPAMFEYILRDRFEWADGQCFMVNWTAIG